MSDYDLPDLPSDEELGISEEDLKAFEEEARKEDAAKADATEGAKKGAKKGAKRKGATDAGGGAPPPEAKKRPSPPVDRPAGHAWRGPLTLLVLLALGWATRGERALPDTVGPTAPDSVFSSGRAMLHMVEKARTPHPPGSPGHDRVRDMLLDRLVGLGLAPEVQTTTSMRRRGEQVATATVRNVLARIPGTESTGAILLTAHYDGRGMARAAGDDGAGVSAILETVRALQAGPRLRNDVLVLLTDAEELGLLGARAFVEEHPWMEDVAVVLSVEMRGGGGPSIMFETGSENGWIVDAFGAGAPDPFANSLSVEIYRRMPNDTDFSPFRDRGVQGLNFAGIGNAHVYHQQWDEPARFDERTLQHHGAQLLGMTRELGARDLADVDAPDRVYFTVPLLGLIAYPTAVGYALAMLLLLGWIAVFVVVGRRPTAGGDAVTGRASGAAAVLAGLLLSALSMAVTAGAAWGLFAWTRTLHPEFGSLHGSAFHVESWYAAAVVAVALAATVVLLALFRRRFALGALALGAAVPAVLGSIVLAFAAPLAGHNLQIPALLALAGALLVAGVGPRRRVGLAAWIGLLVFAAGVAAIAVPLTGFVWLALSFAAAPVLGALVALWLTLLLPLLDTLREPGGGWAPVLGLVAAAAFTGVGVLHATPSPERPAPSTLVYVLDRDSAGPVWATRDVPGADWARARAGALDATRYLDHLGARGGPWRAGPAPSVDLALPRVTVLGAAGPGSSATAGVPGGDGTPAEVGARAGTDRPAGTADGAAGEPPVQRGDAGAPAPGQFQRRTVSVAVRSEVGAEQMVVRIPESADVHLRAVPDEDPEDRDGARRASTVSHWGRPVEDAGVRLTLDVGAAVDELDLEVVEYHLRPGELVGESFFVRPPSLAPDITTGSDRAIIRTVLRIDPDAGTVRLAPPPPPRPVPDAAPGADTAAVPDTSAAPDTAAAADTAAAPDTSSADAAVPDTSAAPDTAAAPDTGGGLP